MSKLRGNVAILLLEQGLKAGVGVAVGIYVARYLGPASFGVYSLVQALVALFVTISKLGLDGVLVRDLLLEKRSERQADLRRTSFTVVALSSTVSWGALVAFLHFWGPSGDHVFGMLLASSTVLLQCFTVHDWVFQSREKMAIMSICRSIALVSAALLRIGAVHLNLSLDYFLFFFFLEQLIVSLLYVVASRVVTLGLQGGRFSGSDAKALLSSSWPLLLSSVSTVIYTRIDQLMIAAMLGEAQVGIYSATVRFYDAWMPVPYLITVAAVPYLVRNMEKGQAAFETAAARVFGLLFWAALMISLVFALFPTWIIGITFGPAYLEGATCLALVMASALWTAMGSASARYMIMVKMEKTVAYRTVIGAVINILLNLVLIPRWGIQGAAMATFIASFICNVALDWFDRELAQLRRIKRKAFLLGFV